MAKNISSIRKKYENLALQFISDIDRSNYNTNKLKEAFSKMNDAQFIKFVKRIVEQDDCNLSIEVDSYDNNPKTKIDLNLIQDVSKKYNIPLEEYVISKFRNPNGKPTVTCTPIPIIYVQVKRFFQQMLLHKNDISNSNGKINPITGQVTGEDKTASLTDVQTYALSVINQNNAIKEFLGPRADDKVSKQEMETQITQKGHVSLNDLTIKTHNKQSINTVEAYTKAACIDVVFDGNDNDEMKKFDEI